MEWMGNRLKEWRNSHPQLDDVLVVGARIQAYVFLRQSKSELKNEYFWLM